MKLEKILLVVIASLFFMNACGSDTDSGKGEQELCMDYCAAQVECRSTYGEDYLADCQATCEAEEYDNSDLDISTSLIRCGRFQNNCDDFILCYNNGGSLTDDIYGYQEQ